MNRWRILFWAAVAVTVIAAVAIHVHLWRRNTELTSLLRQATTEVELLREERAAFATALQGQLHLERAVREHRDVYEEDLAGAASHIGTDRIDYLVRLLEDDAARRCGVAAKGADGPLPGTGEQWSCIGVAPQGEH